MKTDSVEVTLQASNLGIRNHTFKISVGNKELFLLTPEGKEIARITVQTMTKDVKDEEGDYHTKPSKNFCVCFEPSEIGCSKDSANAWIETP